MCVQEPNSVFMEKLLHVSCRVYKSSYFDNAELVSRSNSVEDANILNDLFQLMFRHSLDVITRQNLHVSHV
jgi:hypothetical protein